MSSTPDFLVIGTAPRPTSSADLETALHSALASIAWDGYGATVAGIDSAVINTELAGADIALLDIDLSGVSVTISGGDSEPATPKPLGAPIATQDATLHTLRVHADPLTISGVGFTLDASADAVPFLWAEDAAGLLAIGERPNTTERTRVRATVEADRDALVAAAVALAEGPLAEAGVAVSDVQVESESIGPREATVTITARLSRGILSAKATASARAKIDDEMVLHLSDVKVSSRNPLVATLLLTVRQRVEEATGRPIDLKPMVPAPLRLDDVVVSLSERVRVEVALG